MNMQDIIQQLQTLDVNNPAAWPKWTRISAAILAGVLVVAIVVWFFVKPKYEELEGARQQEQALRVEFEAKQKKVAGLDAYREQLAEMERSFGTMLKQLPSKAEVANLLNDISQTRAASSLEEELFQPQAEIPKEFYAELPNSIIVTGGYHEIGAFVSGVAALPRIVTIDEIEIKSNGKTGDGGATQLRMAAIAKTYRYLDDDEIAAQEKPAKAKAKGKK